MMSRAEIRATLLVLVGRPGGFCRAQDSTLLFDGVSTKEVSTMMSALAQAGLIHAVRLSHRTVRYFSTVAEADSFRLTKAGQPKNPSTAGRVKPQTLAQAAALRAAPAVVNSGTKMTICPSGRDFRFSVDPSTQVQGGFMSEWRALRAGGQS